MQQPESTAIVGFPESTAIVGFNEELSVIANDVFTCEVAKPLRRMSKSLTIIPHIITEESSSATNFAGVKEAMQDNQTAKTGTSSDFSAIKIDSALPESNQDATQDNQDVLSIELGRKGCCRVRVRLVVASHLVATLIGALVSRYWLSNNNCDSDNKCDC